MSQIHLATIGDASQVSKVLKGEYVKGRNEPRVAFVGRSNVGKSSFINTLLPGKPAQVSNQPGKTRAIYFYDWKDANRILVDLPGFGFAKAGQAEIERWNRFITAYLQNDPLLEWVILLLDAKVGPTPTDWRAIEFLKSLDKPLGFVMTKSDKIKNQSGRAKRQKEVKEQFQDEGFEVDDLIWTSIRNPSSFRPFIDRIKSTRAN